MYGLHGHSEIISGDIKSIFLKVLQGFAMEFVPVISPRVLSKIPIWILTDDPPQIFRFFSEISPAFPPEILAEVFFSYLSKDFLGRLTMIYRIYSKDSHDNSFDDCIRFSARISARFSANIPADLLAWRYPSRNPPRIPFQYYSKGFPRNFSKYYFKNSVDQ